MADFWGLESVCTEMDDDKGTSLVIVHSEKGSFILRELSEKMRCREVDFEEAIKPNPAMIRSAKKPKQRDVFMQKIHTEDFECLVQKCAKDRIAIKIIVRRILNRLGLLEFARKMKNKVRGKI